MGEIRNVGLTKLSEERRARLMVTPDHPLNRTVGARIGCAHPRKVFKNGLNFSHYRFRCSTLSQSLTTLRVSKLDRGCYRAGYDDRGSAGPITEESRNRTGAFRKHVLVCTATDTASAVRTFLEVFARRRGQFQRYSVFTPLRKVRITYRPIYFCDLGKSD